MPVTRFDLTELLGDAFTAGPLPPNALLRIAQRRGARSAVLLTLRRLPARLYRHLDDVLHAIPDLPDEVDPWNSTNSPD